MAQLTGKWKQIADEIDAVFKRHGMQRGSFRVRVGAYESRITLSVAGNAQGAPVDPFAKAVAEYKRYLSVHGFKLEWLGREFSFGSKRFKLQGFDMGRPKNYVVLTNIKTGKTHIAPGDAVKRILSGGRLDTDPLTLEEELV